MAARRKFGDWGGPRLERKPQYGGRKSLDHRTMYSPDKQERTAYLGPKEIELYSLFLSQEEKNQLTVILTIIKSKKSRDEKVKALRSGYGEIGPVLVTLLEKLL